MCLALEESKSQRGDGRHSRHTGSRTHRLRQKQDDGEGPEGDENDDERQHVLTIEPCLCVKGSQSSVGGGQRRGVLILWLGPQVATRHPERMRHAPGAKASVLGEANASGRHTWLTLGFIRLPLQQTNEKETIVIGDRAACFGCCSPSAEEKDRIL